MAPNYSKILSKNNAIAGAGIGALAITWTLLRRRQQNKLKQR